jgi:benzoate 4-monooxygenase
VGHARQIAYVVHCVLVDSLRHIPGPLLGRHLPGWLALHAFRGQTEAAVLHAHSKYGDVVRIGPRTVLAGSAEAVRKVFGYGENYLDKSADYNALVIHTPSIFSETDRTAHARKRRIAAHAYSMQSLTKMEDVVAANLDVFLRQMDACALGMSPMDAAMWFKFYAFDVIGDLAFGRSFGMLQRGVVDDFVTHISDGVEFTFVVRLTGF